MLNGIRFAALWAVINFRGSWIFMHFQLFTGHFVTILIKSFEKKNIKIQR